MEKTSIQHGEISVQKLEGDFSILNGENVLEEKRKTNKKKKVHNASEKVWMEKSPFRMEISQFWMEKQWIIVSKKKQIYDR